MPKKKIKRRRPSLLWSFADRMTAMIYSFFVNGRVGDMLSSNDTFCRRSYLANTIGKSSRAKNAITKYPKELMEMSVSSRTLIFLRRFFAALKLNVYGMFFTFYGLSALVAHLIPVFMGGLASLDEYAVIPSAVITLCSVPLIFSSQSALGAISNSKIMSKIVLDIMCIPSERLKVKRQYGGTIYIFISAVIAMALGALSIFTHPMFVPTVLCCLIAAFVIFSFPETGVILSLVLTPFLQYLPDPELILLAVVCVTAVSYLCKAMQRKRTFSLSPEITMVILFCGFILTGGMFSYGGFKTFTDSLVTVVFILGGFLLTYNLANTAKTLSVCTKMITSSYLLLCIAAIWESVYNGISARIIDHVDPTMGVITEENIFYILDNGVVFGMFAVLIFPLLFAYMTKRKSFRSFAVITVFCIIVISAAWMRSHYEVIAALIVEAVIFWFMYSHKTMTAVIFALIPVGIVAMLYPYAVRYFAFPDISEILMEYMPASLIDSEHHTAVVRDVLAMISDGRLFGIGAGERAFGIVFPMYGGEASAGASDPMSLWLSVLVWSGIFGFAAFAIFVIFLIKRSLGYFIASERGELRSRALALFCGIFTAMLLGCVYGIWADARVMYLFWSCSGLLMGYIRLGDNNEQMRMAQFADSESGRDVEVVFYD